MYVDFWQHHLLLFHSCDAMMMMNHRSHRDRSGSVVVMRGTPGVATIFFVCTPEVLLCIPEVLLCNPGFLLFAALISVCTPEISPSTPVRSGGWRDIAVSFVVTKTTDKRRELELQKREIDLRPKEI